MTSRRQFLTQSLAAALVAPAAFAQGVPSATEGFTVLVDLFNFRCSRCRMVNDHIGRIYKAATEAGLMIRSAPVAWEGQSLWPNRVFYAVRDLFPEAAQAVRDLLFDGIHREGQLFEELAQVLAYMERNKLDEALTRKVAGFSLVEVADKAASDEPLLSEIKAARLVQMSGATEVPVFVWLSEGQIVKTITPAQASDPISLANYVVGALSSKDKK